MEYSPVKPDLVRYEIRVAQGQDPFAVHQKKPGGFGRFLSAVGRFFGAVAAPFSIFFPPAMIGALGMYGLGQIGDQMQQKAYMNAAQQGAKARNIVFPGMEDFQGGPQAAMSPMQTDVLKVLYARNDVMMEQAHGIVKP